MSSSVVWSEAQLREYCDRTGQALMPGGAIEIPHGVHLPPIKEPIISKGRQPNRTESEYGRILRAKFAGCQVLYEAYTLKLAHDCRYTPDFAVVYDYDYRVEFFEVKGAHVFEKALVKPRIAARMFPQHTFTLAQRIKGEWTETEFAR